jgi:putative hydrolase of the HAD superfamily
MLKAIIFDMDDTLYPETAYVFSGFRAVAEWGEQRCQWNAAESYQILSKLFHEGVRGDTFNRWLTIQGHPMPEVGAEECVRVYRNHQPTISLYEGVPDLLRTLKRCYKLGMLGDGYLAVQQKKFKALELAQWFDAVVFSDQWGRESWKPSTRPFIEMLALLGVEGSEAVYIGDNPTKDFIGARQVGMKTLWYQSADGLYVHREPPTKAHYPDQILTSYRDLFHTLEQFAFQL